MQVMILKDTDAYMNMKNTGRETSKTSFRQCLWVVSHALLCYRISFFMCASIAQVQSTRTLSYSPKETDAIVYGLSCITVSQ